MAHKGRFKPSNPEKYKGDPTKIIFRSSWERKVFGKMDKHPDVIEWQSEEIFIPYFNPAKKKISRYFPDIIATFRTKTGDIRKVMIEIKPLKQTKPPDPAKKHATPTGRVSRRYLNEAITYAINEAKWEAARKYCNDRGWEFMIMTEKEIY